MLYDLVIIGGGPAGLTAGLYGARGGLSTLLIEMGLPGGQAATTDIIENYPGFPEGISGPELMQKFADQAAHFGMQMAMEAVTGVELTSLIKVISTTNHRYEARTVIIATGAVARPMGVPGEAEYRGRGVSYCATCDGAFFRGKKVAVAGGGDSAVEEALFLTKFASQVVIIHRRDSLRAARVAQERAFTNEKVGYRWNMVVEEVLGGPTVTSLRLKNVKTGEIVEEPFDGVFVFVGTVPNTGFLKGVVELNEEGYITSNSSLSTSVPGVFVAGDVREKTLRQVSTAVGDGAVAAMSAEKYLAT
ncbi:MAG: thioredoxin-disulfide reductase [Bacillota bacterium]